MSDTLDLTFAELEFLFAEDPIWPTTRAALGIEPPPEGDAVAAAGLASLVVRGLVQPQGEEIVLSEELSAAALVLSLPSVWLDLALEKREGTLAGYVGLGRDEPIVVLSIAAPGVFTLQAHANSGDAAAGFGSMVAALAQDGRKLLVQARSLESDNVVFAARSDDGTLAVGSGPDALTPASAEQVGQGAAILAQAALAG